MYQNQQAACTAQVGVRWGGQMEMERTNMHACMFVSMETDIDDLLQNLGFIHNGNDSHEKSAGAERDVL